MATQAISSTSRTTLAQRSLQVDAVGCALSGLGLIAGFDPVSKFLGINSALTLVGIGAFLVAYSFFLWRNSRQDTSSRRILPIAILVNVVTVLGSYLLVFTNILPLTTEGRWAIAIQAELVLILGAVQLFALVRGK